MRFLGIEFVIDRQSKPCTHQHITYIGKGGYKCDTCNLFGFKDNNVFTVVTIDNLYEAMEYER